VAWVVELKNVQSAFFGLLALLAYLPVEPAGRDAPNARARRAFYALACCSSPRAAEQAGRRHAAAHPADPDLVEARVRPQGGRRLGRAAPGHGSRGRPPGGLRRAPLRRRHRAAWQLSALERILVAGRALWFYAAKLAWPVNLLSVYPRWPGQHERVVQYLYPAGAAALVAVLWLWRGRLGRGPLAAVLGSACSCRPVGIFKRGVPPVLVCRRPLPVPTPPPRSSPCSPRGSPLCAPGTDARSAARSTWVPGRSSWRSPSSPSGTSRPSATRRPLPADHRRQSHGVVGHVQPGWR